MSKKNVLGNKNVQCKLVKPVFTALVNFTLDFLKTYNQRIDSRVQKSKKL